MFEITHYTHIIIILIFPPHNHLEYNFRILYILMHIFMLAIGIIGYFSYPSAKWVPRSILCIEYMNCVLKNSSQFILCPMFYVLLLHVDVPDVAVALLDIYDWHYQIG